MTDKPKKSREDLALGVLNPKTGRRKGGFIEMYRAMRQWQDWLTSGEKDEDDLIEAAFAKADDFIAKRDAAPGEDPTTDYQEDIEYRAAQEERYRSLYEWNEANDEAALQQLLDLEVQARATNREFARAHLPVKERVALLGELRNIAKDHSTLQQKLGIDRVTRDDRARKEDPMQALQEQIKLGAAKVRQLREEWAAMAPTILTIEELIARAQHHSGLPQEWIVDTLEAHKRLLGIAVPSDSTAAVVE